MVLRSHPAAPAAFLIAAALLPAAGIPATAIEAAIASPLTRPQPESGSFLREADYRIARIGYRIATRGSALCPQQVPLGGMLLHHLAEYGRADRPAMATQGLDRGPGVLAVVPGGPADAAGLRAGDVLLAANGAAFASPVEIAALPDRDQWRPRLEAEEARLESLMAAGPVRLALLRDGAPLAATLTPVRGCPLRVRLAASSQLTAVTQGGRYIVLTDALVALTRNDDEIAFLIAHELAHIALEHTARMAEAGVPRRGIARGAGANGRVVRRTEEEADRLGGELVLAAGYDLALGVEILARMPEGLPNFGLFRTHPPTGERIRAMRALAAAHAAR
ncbi:M48 family metalloprotease [Sphingomonas canadensis]|uniref:M48 family metalloprotease n=1 Tax=Sphingomonas canadensis TaxID=1219257 RepID=A0ABW3H6Z7_9SPHN|nr:M48 family metallopeptidase [Sphingomonas canadensis]MCW3835391.1 M48 family metallopeptidase [Sphingomonas canadensis]